jgi:hypothetical protein
VPREVEQEEVVRAPIGEEPLDLGSHLAVRLVGQRLRREGADLRIGQDPPEFRHVPGRRSKATQFWVVIGGVPDEKRLSDHSSSF